MRERTGGWKEENEQQLRIDENKLLQFHIIIIIIEVPLILPKGREWGGQTGKPIYRYMTEPPTFDTIENTVGGEEKS